VSEGDVGYYTSIAIDGDEGVHISHCDYENKDLEYAYKPKVGNWTFYTIDYVGEVGMNSEITIDNQDGVHIVYDDLPNWNLKYVYKPKGGDWSVPSVITSGYEPSITADDADGLHVSYRTYVSSELNYAYKPNGGSWSFEKVDVRGEESSIIVDSENSIHIAYYTGTELKYATKPDGGEWANYTLDSSGGYEPSIKPDSENGIHISYLVSWEGLQYIYKPYNGTWVNSIIDPNGYGGQPSSLAIDSKDGIHISYFEDTNETLKYAYKPKDGNWSVHQLDSPYTGHASSIAMDNSDGVHISYQDYKDNNDYNLKYASLLPLSRNIQASISWTPSIAGLRNITVKIDENNEIDELDETNNEATINVTVDKGPLWNIEVIPSPVVLELNESQQFTAIGTDYFGNEVSILPTWDANGGGTIDQEGLFTATYPGTWRIYSNQSGISGYSMVTISVNLTADTDADGMLDWWEIDYSLDPFNGSDANFDADLDGLTNIQEFLNYSKPKNNDTDGDNLGDGFEVIFSKTNASLWDTNGNGIGDGLEFIQSKGYLGWIESLPDDWIGMTITWDNYTILVKTNSSVLEGEFDNEEQELKIKISGPEGTQGVTEIQVPKILCEPEDIEIILDGELINYTLTEYDTYYYIHIEYNHSIHELSASFETVNVIKGHPTDREEEPLATIYLIYLICALVVILLLSIVIIKNRGNGNRIGVRELSPDTLSLLLDKQHNEGKISDETYKDAKSLLEKYIDK
jgi:hypothetical protein